MSETQNTYLENLHTSQESITGLEQEKYEVLKNYPNFSTFEALLKTNFQNKDVFLKLLNQLDTVDIDDYFLDGFTLVDQKGIDEFINAPQFSSIIEKHQNEEKQHQNEEKQHQNEEITNKNEKQFEIYNQYYKVFKDSIQQFAQKENNTSLKIILQALNNLNETNKEQLTQILKDLGDYFQNNPGKLQEIFSSLKND